MSKKLTHYKKIEQMLKEGWTSPLDAWNQWSILTSFRSRVSEIREDYRYNPDWILEERNRTKKNRDDETVTYKEFRLIRVEKAGQQELELS